MYYICISKRVCSLVPLNTLVQLSYLVFKLLPLFHCLGRYTDCLCVCPGRATFSRLSALNDTSKPASEVISETMKAEGGPSKGSTAAQMQSEVAKSQQGSAASNTTKSPEGQTISEVAKEEGGTTKGSKSAQMQSELTKQRNVEQGVYNNDTNGTATSKSPEAQTISEVAKAEGGTTKGSKSAQMQSELTKQRNAEQGVYDDNATGIATGSNTGTSGSPAGQIISEVAKSEGGTTKGSTSAKMQSELSKAQNAGQTPNLSTDPTSQSPNTKENNFEDAKAKIVPKMENNPEHVTQEDANLLRSRDTRAHGMTEKGGVAATAQHLAAENEKKGTA